MIYELKDAELDAVAAGHPLLIGVTVGDVNIEDNVRNITVTDTIDVNDNTVTITDVLSGNTTCGRASRSGGQRRGSGSCKETKLGPFEDL